MLKDVKVEGSVHVGILVLVPLESDDSELKSVHARAVMAQFLVAVFNLVKAVDLVFVADVQA